MDTAHALIDDRATREALYVAATGGAECNTIYASSDDQSAEPDHGRLILAR